MSRTSSRRLSVRRGSVSAPDPLGANAFLNYDPNRSSSSTLTIVRVADPPASAGVPLGPSDVLSSRRSLRRNGSASASSPTDNRLSFALSSFSPASPQPPSPLLSSGPPSHISRAGSSPSSSPRLRPSSPQFTRRHSASGGSAFSRLSLAPEQLVDLARQSSVPRYLPASHLPNAAVSDVTVASISPATFTPLPVDVYLPFIDRVAETAHLLSTPPTKKLFSLLAQTFPAHPSHDEVQDPFTVDPAQWTFNTLRRWLTEVDRSTADDAIWVQRARKCVLSHSELIWERLKGALGVPPELELDDLDTYIDFADREPIPSLIQDEHFSDVVDSPHQSPDSISLMSSPDQSLVIEPILATSSTSPPPSTPGASHPPPSSLLAGLAQSSSKSQLVDQVLQDIVEGEEEDEEESGVNTAHEDRNQSEDDTKVQIHGLRVCTSPVPPSSAVTTPHVFSYPSSPAMSLNASGRNSVEPRSPDFSLPPPLTRRLSRTSSHGSIASVERPLSGSFTYRDFGHSAVSSEIGDVESDRVYDPIGDRGPGNPLFPSNFARLALGPTLRANNPALRSSHATNSRWKRWAPGNRPPSWFEGWDAAKHEYAATVASGSSVGGGE